MILEVATGVSAAEWIRRCRDEERAEHERRIAELQERLSAANEEIGRLQYWLGVWQRRAEQ